MSDSFCLGSCGRMVCGPAACDQGRVFTSVFKPENTALAVIVQIQDRLPGHLIPQLFNRFSSEHENYFSND